MEKLSHLQKVLGQLRGNVKNLRQFPRGVRFLLLDNTGNGTLSKELCVHFFGKAFLVFVRDMRIHIRHHIRLCMACIPLDSFYIAAAEFQLQ